MRTALFFSGRGSTLQAALDMRSQCHLVLAVTNNPNALGITRARRAGVPVLTIKKPMDALFELRRRRVQRIFLLGYMRLLPSAFLQEFKGLILNVHPSLLPKHKGATGFEDAWKIQDPIGASIHHVIEELDSGAILRQRQSSAANFAGSEGLARLKLAAAEQSLIREVTCKM